MELALLRAIQELPGRQRAVLIFRDVLGWTAPEVAELLESSVASVNSALQRARGTIDERLPATPRAMAAPDERELLDRYVTAFEHDDMDGLVALLREDAVMRMPPQPSLIGALQIARFFREVAGGGTLARFRLTPTRANGRPAVAIYHRRGGARMGRARDLRTRDRGWTDRRNRLVHQAGAAHAVRIRGRAPEPDLDPRQRR